MLERPKEKHLNTLLIFGDSAHLYNQKLSTLFEQKNYQFYITDTIEKITEYSKSNSIDLVLIDSISFTANLNTLIEDIQGISTLNSIPIFILMEQGNTFYTPLIEAGVKEFFTVPLHEELLFYKIDFWIDLQKKKTEKRENDTLLREYKNIIDQSTIISKTTPAGIITYVNQKFCEISGYSYEELIGQPHNIVRHPDTPKFVFKELWSTIKNKQSWHDILKNKRKDGTPYWVDAYIHPILTQIAS